MVRPQQNEQLPVHTPGIYNEKETVILLSNSNITSNADDDDDDDGRDIEKAGGK